MYKQSGASMVGHHRPSIVTIIFLNTTEREINMAKRTDAKRIRAYMKKHPAAKPKDVSEALGVHIANVYYVRKTMRDKDVIDFNAVSSLIQGRAKTRMQGSSMREHGNSNVDLVNHPPHYTTGGIETIDFIEAKKLNYNLGNVVKYITRADHKGNRAEDLRKAKWYLEREILAQHI